MHCSWWWSAQHSCEWQKKNDTARAITRWARHWVIWKRHTMFAIIVCCSRGKDIEFTLHMFCQFTNGCWRAMGPRGTSQISSTKRDCTSPESCYRDSIMLRSATLWATCIDLRIEEPIAKKHFELKLRRSFFPSACNAASHWLWVLNGWGCFSVRYMATEKTKQDSCQWISMRPEAISWGGQNMAFRDVTQRYMHLEKKKLNQLITCTL